MKALCGGALFIAACLTWGGAGIHASAPEDFEISLHVHVDRSIGKLATGLLEDEAASIWKQYGVQLQWDDTPDFWPTAHGWSLDVMLQPRIEGAALPRFASVLGTASVNLDAPTRQPIHVSFAGTEDVLALARTARNAPGALHERQMARALGRVLAHEIGHVLLAAPYHDDAGLMRARFLPDELAEADRAPFRLTCTGVGRLRHRLRTLTGDTRVEVEAPEESPCVPGHPVR